MAMAAAYTASGHFHRDSSSKLNGGPDLGPFRYFLRPFARIENPSPYRAWTLFVFFARYLSPNDFGALIEGCLYIGIAEDLSPILKWHHRWSPWHCQTNVRQSFCTQGLLPWCGSVVGAWCNIDCKCMQSILALITDCQWLHLTDRAQEQYLLLHFCNLHQQQCFP